MVKMDLNRMWIRFIQNDDAQGGDKKDSVPSSTVFVTLKEAGTVSPTGVFFYSVNDGQVIITS